MADAANVFATVQLVLVRRGGCCLLDASALEKGRILPVGLPLPPEVFLEVIEWSASRLGVSCRVDPRDHGLEPELAICEACGRETTFWLMPHTVFELYQQGSTLLVS